MMGYPDQARAANRATEANARRDGHPFDLAFALTLGAQLFDFLCDSDALLRRTEEAERLGREHGIPLLGEIMVEISRGIAWLRAGRWADGAAQLERGVAASERHRPPDLDLLSASPAGGGSRLGRRPGARLGPVNDSVAHMEAGEERSHYAEVLRLKGWLASLLGPSRRMPKRSCASRSIALGRSKQDRGSFERPRRSPGCGQARSAQIEALALLGPVYRWFSEGHDTKDLMTAAQLLEELGRSNRPSAASRRA